MAVDWQQLDDEYYELLGARQRGDEQVMAQLGIFHRAVSYALDEHVADVVHREKWTWQRVGDALGVTRQAASKRWAGKYGSRAPAEPECTCGAVAPFCDACQSWSRETGTHPGDPGEYFGHHGRGPGRLAPAARNKR